MARKKRLPIGIEDFKELIEDNYYFVDKTGFIADFMDNRGKVTLFTRPRRFGKTLTLSMLLHFFTLENAAENRKLFTGLNIEKRGEEYMAEQGTRPVVFLTLKDATARNFDDTIVKVTEVTQRLYERYDYLLKSDKISDNGKNYFRQLMDGTLSVARLQSALVNLMQMLTAHHGKKSVLLLDEYDAPIIYAVQHNFYDECIDFMRGLLSSAFKTNPALDFAVLTGVTRVSKESIFSGLNHFDVHGVLSNNFSDAFGFTQAEVDEMMRYYEIESELPELKKWYDGYQFGKSEIYNPWSIINFVQKGSLFRAYWINVSGNVILKDMLARVDANRREQLTTLLNGGTIDTPLEEGIVYSQIFTSQTALFSMLLTSGYLKAIKTWQDEYHEEWIRLKIPNLEIWTAYRREIANYIVPTSGEILLRDMTTAMTNGNATKFAEHLAAVLRDFVSYHDTASESFYHGLLLGLSVGLFGKYTIESNAESGYGRFDIAFIPAQGRDLPGVVLEIKITKNEDELEATAQKALAQIDDKKYTAKLSAQGAKVIWRYGVAFCGKKVWLAGE